MCRSTTKLLTQVVSLSPSTRRRCWYGGLIPDLTRICGQAWQSKGDLIYLPASVWRSLHSDFGMSEYNEFTTQPPGYRH